jgi:hypothetical protein
MASGGLKARHYPSNTEAMMAKDKANGGASPETVLSVGNPAAAAAFAVDQSHMEDFANPEEKSSIVEVQRPPKGQFFTVQPEADKSSWQNRAYYFLMELEGRDPLIVAPNIAKMKQDEEDTIRPVLLVRYVTMTGEEALWPVKLDRPDGRSNAWNVSALNILEIATSGKWVRIVSLKKHYRHQVSKKNFEQVPPRFTDRSFQELVSIAFKDRMVANLEHPIWEELENGRVK